MGAVPVQVLACGTRFPPDVHGVRGYSSQRPRRSRHPYCPQRRVSSRIRALRAAVMSDPASKEQWRKLLRARRRAFVEAMPRYDLKRLWRQLSDHAAPHLTGASLVASYWAVGSELDPVFLEERLRAAGAAIALPRTAARDGPLQFHLVDAHTPLVPGRLSIPEPTLDATEVVPRILLVPVVGVDGSGMRLGQAGGYYDRTLAALRAAGPVFAVGLAYDVQLVEQLPCDPWDQRLDAVATPTRWLEFRSPADVLPDRA